MTRRERIRIGYLTSDNAQRRLAWSGTPYYMAQALKRHGGDLVYLGPVFSSVEIIGKVRNKLSQKLLGRRRAYHHTMALAEQYARLFGKRLRDDLDVIFAPAGATQVALLETDLPIVYASDTTFELMHDYYPAFSGLTQEYVAEANEIERRMLHRARAVVYPSEWAAASAERFYGVARSKIHVFPYGANLDAVPSRGRIAPAKRADLCTLTFLGVNWERKGGPTAFAAVAALREMGVPARLVVCGCVPPRQYRTDWVEVIPRLNKQVPRQQAALSELLLTSSFLLLPTLNDCTPIVFSEASAHGTPSISRDTGGVGGAIRNGRNGYLLPPEAPPQAYAELIRDLFRDRDRYLSLVASSRDTYEETHNWDAWGARTLRVIQSAVG